MDILHLFIYLSVCGHLECFHHLASVNSVALNIYIYKILFENLFSILLGI